MHSSKLFRRVEKITTAEWKPLRNYLKASVGEGNDPYHLFEHIYSYKDRLGHKNLAIERVRQAVFPHLSKKSFQNVMSFLSKEIEDFWVWCDLFNDHAAFNSCKVRSLNKRGFYREAIRVYDKKITQEQTKVYGLWKEYYNLRASHELFFSNNPISSGASKRIELFKNSIKATKQFCNQLLEYYRAEIYNQVHLHGEDWNEILAQLKNIGAHGDTDHLYTLLKLQTSIVEKNYSSDPGEFFQQLMQYSDLLTPTLKLTFYYRLRRSFIISIREGNEEYTDQLVKLIMWSAIERPILINNELSVDRFLGDINVLSAVGRHVQLERYISESVQFLNPQARHDGDVLGQVILNFTLKNFETVIQLFSTNKCAAPKHQLQLYDYFLRAYYELYGSDISVSEYYVRNYSDYIRRNKKQLSVQQVKSRKNFLIIFKQLLKNESQASVLERLHQMDAIVFRRWLREKIMADL